MRRMSFERLASLTGVAFVPLLVASQVLEGNPPDVDAPTAKVVQFWIDHDTEMKLSALLGAVALFFLVWFASSLRATLRRTEGGPGLVSTVAFAGFVMFALGGAMFDGFKLVAADTA